MPKSYRSALLILSALFLNGWLTARDVLVTFKVITPNLSDSSRVFITGNQPRLGNWHPAKTELEPISASTWTITLAFPESTLLEYKFTLGDWDHQALTDEGLIPSNAKLKARKDTVVCQTVRCWYGTGKMVRSGQITGQVFYHRGLQDFDLLPRDLIVWVPPGYNEQPQRRYPVLYMMDGQNVFDPQTSFTGSDWQVDEIADSLIRQGRIEPLIVVGITNTVHRYAEYAPNDTGFAYMKLVVEKIKPFIDGEYRTLSDPENTAVGGSSMGGLVSFMLLWQYPHVFSKAICMSPALIYRNSDYVAVVRSTESRPVTGKFWLDNGGVGLENVLQPGIDSLLAVFPAKGYRPDEHYFWRMFPQAEHTESAWASRMHLPLLLFFGKKE